MDDNLNYKGFCVSVHFRAADDVLYGKILGIDGLPILKGYPSKY